MSVDQLVMSSSAGESIHQVSKISMEKVMREISYTDIRDKRTHIVCTMGPACSDVETIVKMIKAGMNICRFNFSHGTHETHTKTLNVIREAMKQTPEINIGLMLDTKGPEIRTGYLKNHEPINLVAGNTLRITTDYTIEGDETVISCSYPKLAESVKVGNIILIADGSLSCEVTKVGQGEVETKVLNNARIGEYKNMNLPGTKVDLPILTEQDKDYILNFGIPNKMNFIALSFTQTPEEVLYIRKLLGEAGKHIKIIPKIENIEGLTNYDEILKVADGIMVARGDLGMEMPIEKVCLAQKMMIKKANMHGRPIITATQMLESMVNNPRPTRAESADVINAVLDGSDCVMLSGETAGGKFPVQSVEIMAKLCFEAENCFSTRDILAERLLSADTKFTVQESVARAAVFLSFDISAKMIIVLTTSGLVGFLVSKYRPKSLVMALSADENVVKSLTISRGVFALKVDSLVESDKLVDNSIEVAKSRDLLKKDDLVVVVHGSKQNVRGSSDLVKVRIVP